MSAGRQCRGCHTGSQGSTSREDRVDERVMDLQISFLWLALKIGHQQSSLGMAALWHVLWIHIHYSEITANNYFLALFPFFYLTNNKEETTFSDDNGLLLLSGTKYTFGIYSHDEVKQSYLYFKCKMVAPYSLYWIGPSWMPSQWISTPIDNV